MRATYSILIAGFLLLAPASANAEKQPSAANLFQKGQTLYASGRFEEAVKSFLQAQRLSPHRSALFNVARCYENLGRLREALDAYRQTLALSQTAAHRAEVTQRIALLSRRPTKIFIASDPPGAKVTVDGRPRAEQQPTPTVVALRPGEHVVLLHKAGFQLAAKRVDVTLGKVQTLTMALHRNPREVPCPPQAPPTTINIPPPDLVEMQGVHVHIGVLTPIMVTTDRKMEAGPGIQLHITLGRFLFGAHLLMTFQYEELYEGAEYHKQSFRRLLPELEGGWVFPFSNLYFYTSLGAGFHIDRPIFIETNGDDLVREFFAFAWSAGGGVEILANRWVSLGAALRLGMAHGERADMSAPRRADTTHHFPWLSFWAGVTVHL
ncbi:MAG: tetratricopeptide repeat protein [Deltaproteobacteria bacterium]|nr:tetratricopeptide repeat protein [Deltaproteobacteria bacterium]